MFGVVQESVPPVMAFHLGSLGFLSPFEFFDFREKVDDVLQGEWSAQHRPVLLNSS